MKIPYIRAWTRIFKYKEQDSRLVFLVDLLIHFLLFIILVILSAFVLSRVGVEENVAWIFFYSLCIIFAIPLSSMMGRRFWDCGNWPYTGIIITILFPLILPVSIILAIYPNFENRTNKSVVICIIISTILFVPLLITSYVLCLSVEYLFNFFFI